MVRVFICAALGLSLIPVHVNAEGPLTYREYQRELGQGQSRLDYSKQLIGHDQIHTLVPELNQSSADEQGEVEEPGGSEGGEPQSQVDDRATSDGHEDGDGGAVSTGRPRTAPQQTSREPADQRRESNTPDPSQSSRPQRQVRSTNASEYEYISPSLRQASTGGQRNQARVERDAGRRILFGIPIGTEIKVSLDQSASNVQPGLIALRVEQTIQGRKQDLPRGSTLFARSSAVIGSERLYLSVSNGITPDDVEFSASGVIFDEFREPGLAARVISDGKSLARASSEGLNTFGRELLNAAPGDGVTGAAAQAAAGSLIQEQAKEDQVTLGRPAYVVSAEPQRAVVQIEATF